MSRVDVMMAKRFLSLILPAMILIATSGCGSGGDAAVFSAAESGLIPTFEGGGGSTPKGGVTGGPIAGTLIVTVVSAVTNLPIQDAVVSLGADDPDCSNPADCRITGPDGKTTFNVASGPVDVHAFADATRYAALSFYGVDGANVVIPLKPIPLLLIGATGGDLTGQAPGRSTVVFTVPSLALQNPITQLYDQVFSSSAYPTAGVGIILSPANFGLSAIEFDESRGEVTNFAGYIGLPFVPPRFDIALPAPAPPRVAVSGTIILPTSGTFALSDVKPIRSIASYGGEGSFLTGFDVQASTRARMAAAYTTTDYTVSGFNPFGSQSFTTVASAIQLFPIFNITDPFHPHYDFFATNSSLAFVRGIDRIPGGPITLIDVASTIAPPIGGNFGGIANPAFEWSPPPDATPDLYVVHLYNYTYEPTTLAWEVVVPGGTTTFSLPVEPIAGINTAQHVVVGTTYAWAVTSVVTPSFGYNNFRMDSVFGNADAISTNTFRGFYR